MSGPVIAFAFAMNEIAGPASQATAGSGPETATTAAPAAGGKSEAASPSEKTMTREAPRSMSARQAGNVLSGSSPRAGAVSTVTLTDGPRRMRFGGESIESVPNASASAEGGRGEKLAVVRT